MGNRKLYGEERRNVIITTLKKATQPVTGTELANLTNVSRQVIVQDISLLKVSDEPIIATNRGYLYAVETDDTVHFKKKVVCKHTPEETLKELELIVDCGVTVQDVIVEHAFYGELTGSLMISSRFDAQEFVEKISQTDASLLSELTDGIHIHTLVADSNEKITAAYAALKEAGILIEE